MAVLEYVTNTFESARRQADRVVTPDTRKKAIDNVHTFALQRPLLFSFLLAQALFSLVPVLLFTSFVLGTLTLALVSAVFFSLFWVGIAAFVLGSALLVTSSVALLVWLWYVATFVTARFVYGLVVVGERQNDTTTPGAAAAAKVGTYNGVTDEVALREKWAHIIKKEPAAGDVVVNNVGHDDDGDTLIVHSEDDSKKPKEEDGDI